MQDKLLFTEDVVNITRLTRETLSRFTAKGNFPKPAKIGNKNAWWKADVDKWIEEQMNGAKKAGE